MRTCVPTMLPQDYDTTRIHRDKCVYDTADHTHLLQARGLDEAGAVGGGRVAAVQPHPVHHACSAARHSGRVSAGAGDEAAVGTRVCAMGRNDAVGLCARVLCRQRLRRNIARVRARGSRA
jgi:hypothetical protein